MPREMKPNPSMQLENLACPRKSSKKHTHSRSDSGSTESDFSFCSTLDSLEVASEDASRKHSSQSEQASIMVTRPRVDSIDAPSTFGDGAAHVVATTTGYYCATPTGSCDGSRHLSSCSAEGDCCSVASATRATVCGMCHAGKVQDNYDEISVKAETPASPPTSLDAVTQAIHLALVSKGQTNCIKVQKGCMATSHGPALPTLISVELQSGPCAASNSRCYDAVHIARRTLEDITGRLTNVALMSKRVQKEDRGYSLRSSIACVPAANENNLCWDLFHKGQCPRRTKCQWYHPEAADIARVKVSIRCIEEVDGGAAESRLPARFPVMRQKITLGNLV